MPRVSGVSRAPDFPSALGFLPRRPEFQHDDLGLCQGRRLETLSAAFYPNATVEHHPWPPLPYCTPEFVPERQSLATRIGTHFETHVADVACHVWFVECLEWVGWHRLWHELESLWGRCLARGFGHTGSDAEAKLRAEHRRSFQFGENHPKCKMSARPARHRCDFSEWSKLWSVQSIESKFCVGQGVKFSCRRHTNRCAINTPRPPQKHLQQSNCCASSDSRPTSFWKTKKHCDKLANCACCAALDLENEGGLDGLGEELLEVFREVVVTPVTPVLKTLQTATSATSATSEMDILGEIHGLGVHFTHEARCCQKLNFGQMDTSNKHQTNATYRNMCMITVYYCMM